MDLESTIRTIPDFPKKGIAFKDITPLLNNPAAFRESINRMADLVKAHKPNKVAAIESRGFIFGAALAYELGAGFVPLRKEGKLPHITVRQAYETEYSTDAIEIHEDAIEKGDRVIICDDLIATGGTASSAVELAKKLGGHVIGVVVLIELSFLPWKKKLGNVPLYSVIRYEQSG